MFKSWFSGRLKRQEFFWQWLALHAYAAVLALKALTLRTHDLAPLLVLGLLSFWSLAYGLGILCRRLRDAGRSPRLCLLMFVPLVNFILLLYCFFKKSRPEPGSWSTPPSILPAPAAAGIAAASSGGGHPSASEAFSGSRPPAGDAGLPCKAQSARLKDLQELKAMGALSEAEFEKLKKKIPPR